MEDNTPLNEEIAVENNESGNNAENTSVEIEKLESELDQQKEKYLRLVAEFENYKRRTAKEKMEFAQTAGKDIVIPLLDVLDDIDRAEKQMQSTEDTRIEKEGVLLVFNKFRNTLINRGLESFESIKSDFDVEKHEAIAEIDVPEDMKGKVTAEAEKGYLLNKKIIRFAKVVVGK